MTPDIVEAVDEGATVPDLEYVEFSYRRITWNHLIENKMAYFDWREKSEK